MKLKVIDLGDVTEIGKGKCSDYVGTDYCMAPEIYEGSYDPVKADIFALGVILFMMTTRIPLFRKAKPTDPWYSVIIKKNWSKFWGVVDNHLPPGTLSADFKDLIEHLICQKPSSRLSLE